MPGRISPAHAAQIVDVKKQSVHKRSIAVTCSRMNDHSRGLVDDGDGGVLIDDIDGDVLRGDVRGLGLGDGHGDALSRRYALRAFDGWQAVDVNVAVADQPCQEGPRVLRKALRQQRIETARGLRIHCELHCAHSCIHCSARETRGEFRETDRSDVSYKRANGEQDQGARRRRARH